MSTPMPWWNADPLTDALYEVRMRGAFYSWTEASGEGVRRDAAVPRHAELPHRRPRHGVPRSRRRGPGAPRGRRAGARAAGDRPPRVDLAGRHVCSAAPTCSRRRCSVTRSRSCGSGRRKSDAPLALLCGVVAFASPAVHEMLAVLPPIIRVDSAGHPVMAALLPLLAGELRDPRPGGDAVATGSPTCSSSRRCAPGLRISRMTTRQGGSRRCATLSSGRRSPPCIAARATRGPSPSLAARAAMSRSAFAARFAAVVGTPPMTYRRGGADARGPIEAGRGRDGGAVAPSLGYGSEAAFSRAFARITGETPGRVRRSATRRDAALLETFFAFTGIDSLRGCCPWGACRSATTTTDTKDHHDRHHHDRRSRLPARHLGAGPLAQRGRLHRPPHDDLEGARPLRR